MMVLPWTAHGTRWLRTSMTNHLSISQPCSSRSPQNHQYYHFYLKRILVANNMKVHSWVCARMCHLPKHETRDREAQGPPFSHCEQGVATTLPNNLSWPYHRPVTIAWIWQHPYNRRSWVQQGSGVSPMSQNNRCHRGCNSVCRMSLPILQGT